MCLPRFYLLYFLASTYMCKVNNGKTRTSYEVCSNLTIKAPEHIIYFNGAVLVFLLLTLNTFSNVSIAEFK